MSTVLPLHNRRFFEQLMLTMESSGNPWLIDGAGQLWHINDVIPILESFDQQAAKGK